MKFPAKIKDIHKIKKKNPIDIGAFGYENKEKHPIYFSKKCCEEKLVDLLLIGEEGKRHYVLIKDFNTFMYDLSLHRGKNIFAVIAYRLLVQKKTLESHIKDCSKINSKQRIIMPKKGEFIKFEYHERKIKFSFITFADFERILVPENNGKQYPEESYTNKYRKHMACSYGYKLVCVNYKFSKPFKAYLGGIAVFNFINSMIKESKYCSDVVKKHFNKDLAKTK